MFRITVAPGVELDADALKRVAGHFQLPGEHVRLNPDQKFIGEDAAALEARRALFGDRVLVVAETRVDPCANGAGHLINYVLEGVPGYHNAKAFMGPQGFEHLYGMLVTSLGPALRLAHGEGTELLRLGRLTPLASEHSRFVAVRCAEGSPGCGRRSSGRRDHLPLDLWHAHARWRSPAGECSRQRHDRHGR
jgi:hypothetical protein